MVGWFLPLVLFLSEPAPVPLPGGAAKVEVEVGGHKLDLFTYRPSNYKDGPLIVVCHGMQRNADTYRDHARNLGDRLGALVVAPLFDAKRFPNEAYQAGGLLKDGKPQPAEQWTTSLVPKIVDEVRRREKRPDMPCYLIGHSAGGQFLSRLAGSTPAAVERIVIANPGSHLFPSRDFPFPYGFGNTPKEWSEDEALKRYLARPITIYLGTADTGFANLPQSENAKKQGENRYERGKNCFKTAQELAKAKGWTFNWRLVEAPGIGHDGKAMLEHARCAEALLGKTP